MNNGKYNTESFLAGQAARADKLWGPKLNHIKICEVCGKSFSWTGRQNTKSYEKARFCSRVCSNNRQVSWDAKIQSGKASGKHIEYRKIAFKLHGEKCVVCGFDKVLEVHHIDHNRSNNKKENLVPLCPNHHRMIHNSKYSKELIGVIKHYLNGL